MTNETKEKIIYRKIMIREKDGTEFGPFDMFAVKKDNIFRFVPFGPEDTQCPIQWLLALSDAQPKPDGSWQVESKDAYETVTLKLPCKECGQIGVHVCVPLVVRALLSNDDFREMVARLVERHTAPVKSAMSPKKAGPKKRR